MPKLIIEYRENDEKENYFKENTYFIFTLKDKTTRISIAPNEERHLKEIVDGIEESLKDGFHLNKNESFEITEFDKDIIEYEEKYKKRIRNDIYNILRNLDEQVKDRKTTWEEIVIKTELNRGVANVNNN